MAISKKASRRKTSSAREAAGSKPQLATLSVRRPLTRRRERRRTYGSSPRPVHGRSRLTSRREANGAKPSAIPAETMTTSLGDALEAFILDHRPPRPHDRRRNGPRLERLPAQRGVAVWRGV
jgi:hypothetical protein